MRQVIFTQKNEKKWKRAEAYIEGDIPLDSDELARFYVDITDDLAYARTFYPDAPLVTYLNGLAYNLHHHIYKNKKDKKDRLWTFWSTEIPLAIYRQRHKFFWATLIFVAAIVIGIFSSIYDDTFVRLILGDAYVNMTIENIKAGDPMAVYKGYSESGMFLGIGINNIRVSFIAFAVGILASVPTAYILMTNGIMVGAFIYFFAEAEMFWLSFTTIFIHGTLELSAIVIAGAAGMVLGNAWLFPGTYSRTDSLRKGARDAGKIIIALIPVFIMAAFLEAYVTRHYLLLGLPGRLLIILLSATAVGWYFGWLPFYRYRKEQRTEKAINDAARLISG